MVAEVLLRLLQSEPKSDVPDRFGRDSTPWTGHLRSATLRGHEDTLVPPSEASINTNQTCESKLAFVSVTKMAKQHKTGEKLVVFAALRGLDNLEMPAVGGFSLTSVAFSRSSGIAS